MTIIKVGVIGYGYWGPNLARNFDELTGSELVVIADRRDEQLQRARIKYPDVVLTNDYKDLFDLGLDAVIISTPPKTHHPIAKDCLSHNLHVLVEKPITLNSQDAEELMELANAKGLTLMVGHIFEYNSAVLEMKKYIDSQELGDVYYIDSARLNLGLFQNDSNVLWDLAPHDISTLLFLLERTPVSVSAHGMACVTKGVHDVAYINLVFPDNLMAYIHVSWLDPCKVRRITVVGSQKMAVYNDLGSEGKIKVYDKGVNPEYTDTFGEFQYAYRTGDITIPSFRFVEPLREECQHFLDCIMNKTEPRSSGLDGLRVIKILEAAERSMNNGSTREDIQW